MRFPLRSLLAAIIICLAPQLIRAEAALDEGLQKLAARVAQVAREQNQSAVQFGDFIAHPDLKATGGAGLAHLLATQLKAQKIEVNDKASLQLLASFTQPNEKEFADSKFESVVLRITATLFSGEEEIKKLNISVFGSAGLQFTGPTVDLPPTATPEEQEEAKRKRLKHPQAALVGAETRTQADSPFGIEVVVAGRSRVPQLVAGRSFVKIDRGEEYTVRLSNRAPFEAAVDLTIDGLSMFALSTEGNFSSRVLVEPGKTVEIPGWYFSKSETRKFVITSLPESAAGQRGQTANIGTITASFSAAWEPNASRPTDEPGSRSSDPNATGVGRSIKQDYVKVNRTIGQTRAVISVRYNR